MKIELKGTIGVLAAIVVVVGAVFYASHRRASLREQGLPQVKQYVETEVARQILEERKGKYLSPQEVAQLKDFEVTEFHTTLFPGDNTRVRVVVRTSRGHETYHFRFKRVLGSWRLERRVRAGLLTPG